jgi:hypothetical protein
MQSTKELIHALRDLLKLVEEEAGRNPNFAARLEAIAADFPLKGREKTAKQKRKASQSVVPDIFAAFQEKGEQEFRFWLRSLDLAALKAIVKKNGFDPAKASARWTEPDKFVALIEEQLIARLKRGSAFLPTKSENSGELHRP